MANAEKLQNKIKIGFVGAGHIAKRHANALANLPSLEIAGWSASRLANAEAAAANYGGNAMPTEALFAAPEIDAVLLCTPTFLHFEQLQQALAAGKKVFCEKPLTRDLRDADALLEQENAHIYVGHVLRFFHAYNRARQIIQRGDLGAIRRVVSRRLGKQRSGSGDWLQTTEKSGGVLLDLVIHDFDWLLWTFGEPSQLTVQTDAEKDASGMRYAKVHLTWENGLKAEVEGSWLNEESESSLLVEGDAGMLTVSPPQPEEIVVKNDQYERAISLAGLPDPYVMQMKHFVGWLNGLLDPIVSLQEARAALALSLRAIEACPPQPIA